MWSYDFRIELMDSEIVEGTSGTRENSQKQRQIYNIKQVKARLWEVKRNNKFLFYLKANNKCIMLDTLNRLNFDEDLPKSE